MIGYKEIAVTSTRLDEESESGRDFGDMVRERGIDLEGLTEAAKQRALRMAAIIDGVDPRTWPRDRKSTVKLSEKATELITPLQLAYVDGFMAGREVCDPADRIQRFPERED